MLNIWPCVCICRQDMSCCPWTARVFRGWLISTRWTLFAERSVTRPKTRWFLWSRSQRSPAAPGDLRTNLCVPYSQTDVQAWGHKTCNSCASEWIQDSLQKKKYGTARSPVTVEGNGCTEARVLKGRVMTVNMSNKRWTLERRFLPLLQ